ncbi:MFS transporter, SP family, inositol transporter [Sulfobacillus thermosulfidooxidans DSM 9293]|uniref:MFS transporter, SP family, inositol transporter n=1 Tax=Sulfobacillus thermosulfidooxidans (strain DSM 9293 / VKM B-1269 / AT-1) TaxID=929705 RepID=A0A1W1WNT5_SULTA|nr:MFS transporter [Sulfobacillus thermosulfidooxidans]SMC07961.1 MFS transporter, SP family, inositol transporter [Sulfobacillus thermosulfidooxidans DSM 9293]
MSQSAFTNIDDSQLTGKHWWWTVLSGMGDYLDAGSIVAGGVALLLWIKYFHMSLSLVGLIAAFSSNGISTAVGAFVAGFLGDRFGRKFIYNIDLLLYMFGTLLVIFALSPFMLITGYLVMGFAVGADVPTSWSLIAEYAPKRARGKLMGMTNIFWYVGPIVILLLALALNPLGLLGMRLLFGSLFIVALVTYLLRRSLVESPRWAYSHGKTEELLQLEKEISVPLTPQPAPSSRMSFKDLFQRRNVKRLLFITPIYVLWGIPAGTYGFFFPYIFKTIGATKATTSDLMEILYFLLAILAVVFVFMPLNDRIDRRVLYAISSFLCALAFFILLFAPISNPFVAYANVILFGVGQGIGLWPLQRIWSVELFPTEIRNTAQGFLWSIMRLILGIWSFYLPVVTAAIGGFKAIALMITLMFTYNLIVGGVFGPRTSGKTLEEINHVKSMA